MGRIGRGQNYDKINFAKPAVLLDEIVANPNTTVFAQYFDILKTEKMTEVCYVHWVSLRDVLPRRFPTS